MSKGIDYSWARPGAANIVAKGYTFVLRYLSHDSGKTLDAPDLNDLRSHGLDVGVVWESTATRPLVGHDGGVQDAKDAVAEADALGIPSSVPIYFAVDFDINDAQKVVAGEYMKGVISVIGLDRVGAYGGFYWIKYCVENNLAVKFWQTLAWSGGQVHPKTDIYQNGDTDFAGGADIDEARTSDIGVWKSSTSPAPTPSPAPQPSPVVNGGDYVVVRGDNLSKIAANHNMSLAQVEELNPQLGPSAGRSFDRINVGDVVHLSGSVPAPAPSPSGNTYVVVSGDNLSAIAARNGLSLAQIESYNPQLGPDAGRSFDRINVGDVVNLGGGAPAPAPQETVITVPSGPDGYLSNIAAKYGTSVSQIVSWNQGKYPSMSANYVQAGWSIRVA